MTQSSTNTNNRKKAPSANLYTRAEAIKKLHLPKSTFHDYVTMGKIRKIVPPGKKEGYYDKKEIDELSNAMQLFILQYTSETSKFSVATEGDIAGIYDVIASLWGRAVSIPIELRKSWYQKNPFIDYVVKQQDIIVGYLNIQPFKPDTLKLMMEGKKRGWEIKPDDIYTFEPGNSYDCFIGLAVRQDIPNHKTYGMRLIMGFYHVLADFAHRGIKIRKLCATSDRPDGMKLCEDLGFIKYPPAEGSTFNRYELDLETSEAMFAKKYQEAIKEHETTNPEAK
ncbi:hypothetical protein [Dictyobacter arantiisoli]|uniref:Uncharacterized protein n=1 Tax=Dictyobacter arantiisoli TaxID=2014874 RepID=A0A5A5T5J9_9CHLR|nr:hypothetical protein [Dictyobacter arantiisoli]GCF06598.1 hypothetical protein KDI_01620 [Dictyobacter arantiisoli]